MTRIYNVEIDVDTPPAEDKIEKPARGWRNKYLCIAHFTDRQSNTHHAPGEIEWGNTSWPSKDIAETMVYTADTCVTNGHAVHLGAFPEGQDAP